MAAPLAAEHTTPRYYRMSFGAVAAIPLVVVHVNCILRGGALWRKHRYYQNRRIEDLKEENNT
jgi:hypothetical protein